MRGKMLEVSRNVIFFIKDVVKLHYILPAYNIICMKAIWLKISPWH